MSGQPARHLMLIAGEPSGDALGAELMRALKAEAGEGLSVTGAGGPAMEAEGLKSLFPISDTSVMGLKEVVPRIPRILRRVREMADHAIRTRPDAVVLIDSPDFTHRIGRRLKRLAPDIPVIKYVAPQVWASRPWRARKLAEFVDLLLALLPFEPRFFEDYGLPTRFVGHPVIERARAFGGGERWRAAHGLGEGTRLVAVLPGSRVSEVKLLLPLFAETLRLVLEKAGPFTAVVPTVPHVAGLVRAGAASFGVPTLVLEEARARYEGLAAGDVALAASGTVTTELALARVPMVVAYKVGWLTDLLARPFIRVRFYTLVNLIAGEGIVPEFVQESARPEVLADELVRLLNDEDARARQLAGVARALDALGLGEDAPSTRAARAILESLGARPGEGEKGSPPARAPSEDPRPLP